MNSNFEYYKVFYYVSKYQNLTRAASALHTSQPAVTRMIRNLENDLGCKLFIRCKRGMIHTPEGEMLFKYVSDGCANFFKGENIVGNMAGLEKGNIYISATETALHCYLFEAMNEFKVKFPDVHFKILNNSSKNSVKLLKKGQVDIAIISSPIEEEDMIKQVHLKQYEDILIGGAEYKDLSERQVSLDELTDLPWISLTDASFTRRFLDWHFEEHGFNFKPVVEVDTTDMILLAVRNNLGVGFIPPEFAEDGIRLKDLVEIKIQESLPKRCITMVYDSEAPQSAAAVEFRAFLKEREEILKNRENGFRIY